MMVRGEPDYIDQVLRRHAYEAAHPDVEIVYLSPVWQAIIRRRPARPSSPGPRWASCWTNWKRSTRSSEPRLSAPR